MVGIDDGVSLTTGGGIPFVELSETVGIQDIETTTSGLLSIQLSETVGIGDTLSLTTLSGTITFVQLSESIVIQERLSITTSSGTITFVSIADLLTASDSSSGTFSAGGGSGGGGSGDGGPGGGGSGGGGSGGGGVISRGHAGRLNSTLVILEVSYDVCKENMVRIVVGTGDHKLPSIKIRTSATGVISPHLVAEQPFKEQNKITRVDRLVFEAPLDPSEKFFIVTAEEFVGKGTRAIQERVSIIGCEGTIKRGQADSSLDANLRLDMQREIMNGAILRATAYLTNDASSPIFGTVSLVVDEKTVYSSPQRMFKVGTSAIKLEWTTPKVNHLASYQIKAKAEIQGMYFETDSLKLYTIPATQIFSLAELEELKLILDEASNPIAKPAILYALFESNEGMRYKVTAPDGTCVIGGSGCLVEESTAGSRGNLVTITLKDQIYRVRYSGPDNVDEWFTITSAEPMLGKWNVELESKAETIQQDYAMENVFVNVNYRLLR